MSATKLYGCHNIPRSRGMVTVQDGWTEQVGFVPQAGERQMTRLPRMIRIPNPMSIECRYDRARSDARCIACQHLEPKA